MPLEVVMSKYYGESERLLGSVFSLANDLPEGGIIFLDEVYIVILVAYNSRHCKMYSTYFVCVCACACACAVIGGFFCYCSRQRNA